MTHLPIVLPPDYEVLVAKDEKVKTGQVLARKTHRPSEVIIEVATHLHVSPKKLKNSLRKNPGDYVEKGEVIAEKDGFFTDTYLMSEVSGTVAKYDRDSGSIVVKLTEDESKDKAREEVICPLDGKVVMCHNDQIILETEKNVIVGKTGRGGIFQGVLKILEKKSGEIIISEEVEGSLIDKIVFAPSFEREAYAKASAIGVGGILVLELEDSDVSYLLEKRLNFPVIQVTDADGLKIAKWKNKEIFIDGENKAILLLSYEKNTT